MPLNLRMQCYNGRKGYGRLGRAEAESRRGPVAGFDLCYAMQSNRETARRKAARWKQPGGGAEVVVLHRGGGSEGRLDESHAFLGRAGCPPCHKNNKHAGGRETGGEEGGRASDTAGRRHRMYFSDNNVEPIEDARRRTFIPALPHLWWRVIPSRDNQRDSSGFRQPPPSHSHPGRPAAAARLPPAIRAAPYL